MAENGKDIPAKHNSTADKVELRLRNIKERQNEERQRKLEEIKAQALAAQRFKEQKEQERKRRMEELRGKDDIRRQQVEERKKAIIQAEQDRLVSILKRNQEREARFEAKRRNEKSNSVFAFGSSTPRMLDPTDMTPSFWGARRATSIQNITYATSNNNNNNSSLTRRQSERDLDIGSKKRATSAGGLERTGESNAPLTPAGCASGYVGRRKTDLMPTIPSRDRDSSFNTSRKSLNHSPGRAYSMSRLDQLAKPRKRVELPSVSETSFSFRPLSSPRQSSVTRSMSHLVINNAGTPPSRKPLRKSDSRSMQQLSVDGHFIAPRTTRATQLRQQKVLASSNCSEASSRPSSSLSQQSTTSVTSSVSVRHRPSTAPRRQRPASIAITGVTNDLKNLALDNKKAEVSKPPLPRMRKSIDKEKQIKNKSSPVDTTPKIPASPSTNTAPNIVTSVNTATVNVPQSTVVENGKTTENIQSDNNEILKITDNNQSQEQINTNVKNNDNISSTENNPSSASTELGQNITTETEIPKEIKQVEINNHESATKVNDVMQVTKDLIKAESQNTDVINNQESVTQMNENKENEMSTSITKSRITTEEEAKAALAERRRLAREEAERQAEQERLRKEAEAKAELERQREEEEQVQRLIEQQRLAEQERLEEAIKETQRREQEERLRREEEQRSKLLKEEAERKAREEAERKFAEQQERLKNEEKEREARRKRVEDIMRRTRGVNSNNSSSQQITEDKNENNKPENKVNGTKPVENEKTSNVTKNGKDINIVDNIIPNESLKNANTVSINTINNSDSINSNNTWQTAQQYDPLM